MAQTTWKQVVLDTADAYREANGTTDKIPVGELANKVRAGAGTPYTGDNPLTIGQAGFTFSAKTLLKDGLQIINGVNGEDLTDTVADQTTAVEELMKMVSRKIADHKGEGQYVWKKYEMPTNGVVSFTQLTSGTPTVLQVTASGIDLSTVDESAFVGLTGTVNATTYNFVSETKVNIGGSNRDWSYDQTTSQITIQIDIASGTWQNATIEKIYRGYVVSSDTEAYPNGGELDGYWYELVEEGVSGIEYGVVTFTSNSTATLNVSHNLGVTPRYVAMFSPQYLTKESYVKGIFDSWWIKGTTVSSRNIVKDATNITFYCGYYFLADVPYVWVAIA